MKLIDIDSGDERYKKYIDRIPLIRAGKIKPSEMTLAEKCYTFIELYLHIPEGELVGKKVVLEWFQIKFIIDVYDNPNGTTVAILSMARKNAKTALIAFLVILHMVGPTHIKNSQIQSGAMSRDQAGAVYKYCEKTINLSPKLIERFRCVPSRYIIKALTTGVEYKALSADKTTAQGGSPVFAILDEVGQIVGENSEFANTIMTSQGAYDKPLMIMISTQAATDNDFFSRQIDYALNGDAEGVKDQHWICHLYEADDDCDLLDETQWFKANPALGVFNNYDKFKEQMIRASKMPSFENDARNLLLNQRIETSCPFVSRATWQANIGDKPEKPQGKVWCGLDLSSVADLTAFVAVDEQFNIFPYFWLPSEGIREKSRAEKVPYDRWAEQGYLFLTEGKAIEYRHIAAFLRGFFDENEVISVGFDRYLMNFLKPWLVDAGFSEVELSMFVEYGQGTNSMTPALRELEVLLVNGKMSHGNNPILNMCQHNAKIVGDSGARKFDKQKIRGRIDGMVALANAVGVMPHNKLSNSQSFYSEVIADDDPELLALLG